MFGIIFGGLMNGIEKEGLIQIVKPLFVFGLLKFMGIGSNCEHSLPFVSNGSMTTAPCLFLLIYPKFFKYIVRS